jgi:hypothetical protein
MDEVRAKYPDDAILNDIIAENTNICKLISQPAQPSTSPTPEITPTP